MGCPLSLMEFLWSLFSRLKFDDVICIATINHEYLMIQKMSFYCLKMNLQNVCFMREECLVYNIVC